jgi:hypothetical protein
MKTMLRIEILESRALLSTCTVTRLTDLGVGNGFRGDLRYCINKVNAEPGPDTIDFTVAGKITLTAALPSLASDIDIQGPGADQLTIDGAQIARIFTVDSPSVVRLMGLTLQNGRASSYEPGGGIHNSGDLLVERCIITENRGWIYGGGIYNAGTLRVNDSEVSNNHLDVFGFWLYGGGVYNALNADAWISRSTIRGNVIEGKLSSVSMGGGFANDGQATVTFSSIVANLANKPETATIGASGGGIYNGGQLTVRQSLIASNVASGDFWAHGGGIGNGHLHQIVGTSFTYFPGGPMTVVNSTITDNVATTRGDGSGLARGGGVASVPGSIMAIHHSTIARNRSLEVAGYVQTVGGGISNEGESFVLRNSIVAGNTATDAGNDLVGMLTSSDYNLIQDSSGGRGFGPNDILDVDPLLGPLADNGGLTLTISLLPNSPAIDAGDNTNAPQWDQRGPGFPRIVNGTIDIGAFEVQSTLASTVRVVWIDPLSAQVLDDEQTLN